ncbi:MAG: carbohydrate ABC transporter permease [Propionivibrio sp.]|nr:carbohydrate ABC transporter permease [Propionivibrio sp.]
MKSRHRRGRRWLSRAALVAMICALLAFALFPLYYAVISSLRSGSALFTPSLWGGEWGGGFDFSNYADVFRHQPFGRNILNSIVVATAVVAVSLLLAMQAAFALGRMRFRGRATLLLLILMVSMFPQVAVLSGMFELVRAAGLYDSLPGLMLANLVLTLPFTVWVLTTFMRELPKEIEEAALIDGASTFTLVWRIFMPLMWPALVSTGLLAFVVAWNEFLFALTFTLSSQTRTVPVAIALLSGASAQELPWGQIMAASVTVTLPVVALILVFQRRIVSGLTAGAVKG